MKKIFKILGIIAGLVVFSGIVSYLILNEKLPIGQNPKEGDALAIKMLEALNKPAWDSTHVQNSH